MQGSERLALAVAPLAHGFRIPQEGWSVITESELYAGTVRRRQRGKEKASSVEVSSLVSGLNVTAENPMRQI